MIFFISDTHFYHNNVIRLSERPFKDMDEMHNVIIKNWNETIKKTDEIYILGDFSFKGSATEVNDLVKKLHGKKYLIRGNHDRYIDDPDFDHSNFEWIRYYHTFKEHNQRFVLFHYPILEWQGIHHGAIHLYGHVHNNETHLEAEVDFEKILGTRAVNVSAEVLNYRPISIYEVLELVRTREENRDKK